MAKNSNLLAPSDTFLRRHLGPSEADIAEMLAYLGLDSLDALTDAALPKDIRHEGGLDLGQPRGEHELLTELKAIASENEIWRSYIGMGYYGTIVPPVIQRNILENPGWYTQYTPYQAEIAQGRLEALLNYQTMCSNLTGMEISNSSLLDEGTAAAEAMTMCLRVNRKNKSRSFFVSEKCFPQTIAVMQTRAKPLEIELIIGDHETFDFAANPVNGVIVQYPDDDGTIVDYKTFAAKAHEAGALVVVASDLLALTMLQPPGEWGADIVVGNSQRFGVPFGYGGPHAAFFSCREEYKRQSPGRIVGVSRDTHGMPALRLALQTREQHIRRDKATSNICTAQVLLAIMAGFYGAWHGPDGLREIASKVHGKTRLLATGLGKLGFKLAGENYFDTLKIEVDEAQRAKVLDACNAKRINLRHYDDGALGVSLDETVTATDLNDLLSCFGADFDAASLAGDIDTAPPAAFARDSAILPNEVFQRYHAEHEMLRYMYRLQSRDLSLTTSMIPLGSCTMKLNATSEMLPVTWAEFGAIHPFVPVEQAKGYGKMLCSLQEMLCEITGFHSVSLQPNSGAQGEYTGMQVIAAYHASRGESHREICLIPASAHGTNPASAVLAGLKVVGVKCDDHGNIDMTDLEEKAKKHAANLSSIMVTYPSTHGVFESRIRDLCRIIHENGGQVYLDGANLNAQCGICRPGDYGADVCHINLHKTFCIPHGGGGPGMGPIGVAEHLSPFLPGHPVVPIGGEQATGPVSAAPFGSSSILPISWVYINLVGAEGLKKATQVAVLSANYMARRLKDHYPTLYTGETGWVAHEFIAEMRQFKADTKVEVVDIAKRLMDYGFHAPTISFPVPGTMMIEPTESESKEELDRLCDALIQIHGEIGKIKGGEWDLENNPIKNAPHTSHAIAGNEWNHPYSREVAAFPGEWNRGHKFWPPVGRIDDVWGDKHLFCDCAGLEAYADVE